MVYVSITFGITRNTIYAKYSIILYGHLLLYTIDANTQMYKELLYHKRSYRFPYKCLCDVMAVEFKFKFCL